MEITAIEANFLLYALDKFCETGPRGDITRVPVGGYTHNEIQALRQNLFDHHERPKMED